jgi:hypothetical protein
MEASTRMSRLPHRWFMPIVSLGLASPLWAGAIALYSEDFEKFNLSQPPKDVMITGGGEVSIADDSQRGKVLNIKHAGGGFPGLSFSIDPAKVRGRTIKITSNGKCPGTYTPPPDKAWAKPRMTLIARKNNGTISYFGQEIQGGTPEWVPLSAEFKVTDDILSISVQLRVDLVAAEVQFDNFKVELDGAPTAVANPTANGTPTKPAVSTSPIDKTPKNTFEDGGFLFNPDVAKGLKASVKPGATPNTVLLVGPGLPFKEMDAFRPIGKWQLLPVAKEVSGPTMLPTNLLCSLPGYLGKSKPEVVVLFGDLTGNRKAAMSERQDWEDLARICKRMGAIPIFAVQPAGTQDELRKDLLEAVNLANAPALDLKAGTTVPKRLAVLLDLFDRHIFERTPLDAPVVGKPGKTAEDE